MSLLQDLLRIDNKYESDDDLVNVVTPDRTRPSSPIRAASSRPLPGPLLISSRRRDILRAFPTEISQRIFAHLSIKQLAKCALVSKKWRRSQTINYGNTIEKKTFMTTVFLQVNGLNANRSKIGGSGYSSPISNSGYQTPRELKEEQWKLEAETTKPDKLEMRGMYKDLGGRKSKSKTKFGAPGLRDRGGWGETED
ncbi:hypothetical protein H0H93_016855 [Arthromyces matolae]|nr:hypothetical protein H0H93_016855 [Arthromyces matolae]